MPDERFLAIITTPRATSSILIGYAHGVGYTENAVWDTPDPIKSSMDTLENQKHGVAIADENNDRIDGRRSGPPRGGTLLFVLV